MSGAGGAAPQGTSVGHAGDEPEKTTFRPALNECNELERIDMTINIDHLPPSAQAAPPAKRAALAMLYAMGDALDWTDTSAGLEIAGLENPGAPKESTRLLRVAELGPMADLDDWSDALRIAGGMNRKVPRADGKGGINILIRPIPKSKHPWILLDDLPTSRALDLCEQRAGLVVETSAANAQAWLLLDAHLHHPDRTTITQVLASRLGGDPGAANGSQFGRLAGFKQRKAGKEGWTNLLADTTRTRTPWPSAALLALALSGSSPACPTEVPCGAAPPAPLPLSPDRAGHQAPIRAGQGASTSTSGDESAREFAFACHRLRAGWTPERIEHAIAARAQARGKRSGDPQALRYARATVAKALRAVGARS
ncbi:MAG: DNA-primase RepB domain-containing protein [Thiomonas sp.]